MDKCQLPLQILELIVQNVLPPGTYVALPASDIATRTLCSCLRLCKATLPLSQRLLYQSSLYIESPWRLKALLRSYESSAETTRWSLQSTRKLRASTSLYLSPFHSDVIIDLGTIDDIDRLFRLLSDTLQRLVIDMPLRSIDPDEPSGQLIMPKVRRAFEQLQVLTEFVSVRDELYTSMLLGGIESEVWARWQELEHLALYNCDLDNDLWKKDLCELPSLKTVVLTRPDCPEEIDDLLRRLGEQVTIKVINTEHEHDFLRREPALLSSRYASELEDLSRTTGLGGNEDKPSLQVICLNDPDEEDDIIDSCQSWVKDTALDGTLWSWV